MYLNGKRKAGPDGTGLNQPNPEQSSPLHFTRMCHNARAQLLSSTPPTTHFNKMTSFGRPRDPINFQTLCMCWLITYFNGGNMQGFDISVNKMCSACSGTCNKQKQTSREVSMVYCISQNNSKQLRQQRKEAWRVFCNTKWSHEELHSKIRAHLLIAVLKQLLCFILGFQLPQICLSNYDLCKNIWTKTWHTNRHYSALTGQVTMYEGLSKRYEDAPTLCSLITNCFIIKPAVKQQPKNNIKNGTSTF